MKPQSCDTFVVLPPKTANGNVVFGKNSDRPCDEVQEVVYFAAKDTTEKNLKCTYIEIEQVSYTYAVVLSKPSWMWGAEMGANEHGVCVGNEAVWTKLNGPDDLVERLLGMDLVRLALERSKTAKEGVDILSSLLEKYGQGGGCSEGDSWSYHNSFLLADRKEAWIFETAGKWWAAEKISEGYRNISNELSIRTKFDASSEGLEAFALQEGLWDATEGPLDFAKAFSSGDISDPQLAAKGAPSGRFQCGRALLEKLSKDGQFNAKNMFEVLRDDEISMTGSFLTTGSQVSVIPGPDSNALATHWFTATPYPHQSVFKPFIFCEGAKLSDATSSPSDSTKDRRHPLWKAHQKYVELKNTDQVKFLKQTLAEMESRCADDMEELTQNPDTPTSKLCTIFQHMVQLEMNFYSI